MSRKSDILVRCPEAVRDLLTDALGSRSLEALERDVLNNGKLPIEDNPAWQAFARSVLFVYRQYDHVVIGNLGAEEDGRTAIAAMGILGENYLAYGEKRIVKFLAMSPWSHDLARSGSEGHFHTDLNASPSPPALTGIHCVLPDPGAPGFGYNRIARIDDILIHLKRGNMTTALHFLLEEDVEMANDRSSGSWRGRIVDKGIVRFHPETIRAACRRTGAQIPDSMLGDIHEAAMAVSHPLSLDRGEILLFSNHRTLHYRSECSVKFRKFPMEFDARKVHILHSRDERQYVPA